MQRIIIKLDLISPLSPLTHYRMTSLCRPAIAINGLMLLVLFVINKPVLAQAYPANFSQVTVASGLVSPTMAAPCIDGRIFVAQQNGTIRIVKNGQLVTRPFITLPVQNTGERGLLGIAFHPSFATNHYLYLYYTVPTGAYNRISRFTANGDTVLAGSEKLILKLDSLGTATHHNGGTMQFGTDGKLYIGIGENGIPTKAQSLDTYLGKILRINDDGTVPTGNPFTGGSAQRQRIWAYGMRNPFTLSIHPSTGRLLVNDVGEKAWEEVNDCTKGGGNYGWPTAEGTSSNIAFINPTYAYGHGTGDSLGCAITGGTFFSPPSTAFPSMYNGSYFYIDYCSRWIERLTFSNGVVRRAAFASGLPDRPVGIITGADGNLYFLSRATGTLYAIVYSASGAPLITSQPKSTTASIGSSVSFSVTATGQQPISYQWMKNDTAINLAVGSGFTISQVSARDTGRYSVKISNSIGSVISSNATLAIVAKNSLPIARILKPSDTATYAAGQVIPFAGSASDSEDISIPAAAFEWFVDFFHDTHSHPGMNVTDSITSGSITIPTVGETSPNVYYRLYLVVTDSNGAKDTAYRDIRPRLSTMTFNTNPQGMQLQLDGQPFTTPKSVVGVEGMKRTIAAPSPQVLYNALRYTYSSWSTGGTATQTITTPVADATYTATYKVVYRQPENPTAVTAGLNYNYYQGTWTALPAFSQLSAVSKGSLVNISLAPRKREDYFAFKYSGYVSVPTTGIYTFYTNSDEGSRLLIDTIQVVKNDGLHTARQASGKIGLAAGKHRVSVEYFERTGSQSLLVSYLGPNIVKQAIPNSAWYRSTTTSLSAIPGVGDVEDRSLQSLTLSPNPAGNQVLINLSGFSGPVRIQVADVHGAILLQQVSASASVQLSTRSLAAGVYIVRVMDDHNYKSGLLTIAR